MSTKTTEEQAAEAAAAAHQDSQAAGESAVEARKSADTAAASQAKAQEAAERTEQVADTIVKTATETASVEAAEQAKVTAEQTTRQVLVEEGVIPPSRNQVQAHAEAPFHGKLSASAPGPLQSAEEVVIRKKQIDADIEHEHDIIAAIRRQAEEDVAAHAQRIVALGQEADALPAKVRKLMGEVDTRQDEISKLFGLDINSA